MALTCKAAELKLVFRSNYMKWQQKHTCWLLVRKHRDSLEAYREAVTHMTVWSREGNNAELQPMRDDKDGREKQSKLPVAVTFKHI